MIPPPGRLALIIGVPLGTLATGLGLGYLLGRQSRQKEVDALFELYSDTQTKLEEMSLAYFRRLGDD